MSYYPNYVHQGIYQMANSLIPGRKVERFSSLAEQFPVGSTTPPICQVSISFDQFAAAMKNPAFFRKDLFYRFTIYDEGYVTNFNEGMNRFQFLKFLNQVPHASFEFRLSDSTLPAYLSFMESLSWKREKSTEFFMSIDRNRTSSKEHIPLEKAKGKLFLTDRQLLWFSPSTLQRLTGKVDSQVLMDTVTLKKFVHQFMNQLDAHYYTSRLSDYEKAFLAYHYLFDGKCVSYNVAFSPLGISFADDRTYRDQMGVQRLKPSPTKWESRAAGTLQHKSGVCTGQANLLNAMLCSPELSIPAETIAGVIPSGETHSWSEFTIDGKNYQCCTTMKGIFRNLDEAAYRPFDGQYFSSLHPHSSLAPQEVEKIRVHVKSLQK